MRRKINYSFHFTKSIINDLFCSRTTRLHTTLSISTLTNKHININQFYISALSIPYISM